MGSLLSVLDVFVSQAGTRSRRRQQVLPMLASFASMAAASELKIRAAEHEELLRAAGLETSSPLRALADVLPSRAESSVKTLLAWDRVAVSTLQGFHTAVRNAAMSHTSESDAASPGLTDGPAH